MGEQVSNASSITYVPGIDGLRALALVTIVIFHLGYGWLPGGVFSVTLFFTVSGYLITSLVLAEHAATGGLDLRRFWARRFRRLMPAAVSVLLVLAVCGVIGVFDGERLRGDIVWALGYLSNWRSVGATSTYADLFTGETSPVIHFWTLAIEEQFYIVFPLLMWVLLRRRRLMAPVLVLLTAASVASMLLTSSQNVAYYATTSRAAELLVGVLFALVFPVRAQRGERSSIWWTVGGITGLAVYVWLSLTVHTGDGVVYNGALPAFAVVSTLMVASVVVTGPMQTLFAWSPLVAIGRMSYPLYLVHWPVIIALDERRVGFGGIGLTTLRVVVTWVLAFLVTRFVESPIRQRKVLPTMRRAFPAATVAIALTVTVTAFVPSDPREVLAGVDAPDQPVDFGATTVATDDSTPIMAPRPDVRVRVVGGVPGVDTLITDAFESVARATSFAIDDVTSEGCALRPYPGRMGRCESLAWLLSRDASPEPPDVVVLVFGPSERMLISSLIGDPGAHSWLEFETPLQREMRIRAEYIAALTAVVHDSLGDVMVTVWDVNDKDALRDDLGDEAQRVDNVGILEQPMAADVEREVNVWIAAVAGVDARTRVMVVGDSNSFAVAQGIDQAAGDRFDVKWAGGRNCPIVPLVRLRWWEGAEFDLSECPTVDDWMTEIADFAPDAILIVTSGPEQSEQMYEPGGDWHVIGDPVFDELHVSEMARLIEAADIAGSRVVFFNSPGIYSGAFKEAPFAQPERIAAWNSMIEGFVARWPQIAVIDWAAIVNEAETAGGGEPGHLRGDGIHMEAADIRVLMAESVIPALETILETVPPTDGG